MKKKNQLLKTVMIAAAAITISGTAMAQVEMGIRAGANFSNATVKDNDGDKIDTKLNPGFHVGLTFDIPIADEFYIQPAALFTTKGLKSDGEVLGIANISTKATPYYVEVPVNFLYKPALGEGRLLLGAGPYVAYGLGGKWKVDGEIPNYTGSRDGKLEFVNDYDDRSNDDDKIAYNKPFDLGANLLVGYEFSNKLSFQLNGQLGLLNTLPKTNGNDPDGSFKNVGFGVSIGYKF